VSDNYDETGPNHGGRERRLKQRFPLEQDIRYKMLYGQRIAETGVGKTTNISSGGLWMTTESMLTSGMPVELSMTWPVLLNDTCPMKLMIYGCVVRSNEHGAAVIPFQDYSSGTYQIGPDEAVWPRARSR